MRKNPSCSASNLQALVDDQLSGPERDEALRHVLDCVDCQRQLGQLKAIEQFVGTKLDGQPSQELASVPLKMPVANEAMSIVDSDVELSWRRLQERLQTVAPSDHWAKFQLQTHEQPAVSEQVALIADSSGSADQQTTTGRFTPEGVSSSKRDQDTIVQKRLWTKKFSRLAAVAAVVVVGTGIFTTNVGNKALAAMLQTFRVQHLVGVNQDDFSQIQQQLQAENGGHIDLKQYGQIDQQGHVSQQMVSFAQASQLLGHPIPKLPGFDPQHDRVSYQSGTDIVFQLHTGPINSLMHRLGGKTQFPATIDGKPFVFHVPPSVSLTNTATGNENDSYNLQMLKAPSLDVPSGVDIEQVRQALLDLPFVQGNMRNSLLRTEDWKNTLLLPMGGHNAQNITLNGHEAVLNSGPGFCEIMWLQDGLIYTLENWLNSGQSGPVNTVPSTDNLISVAKGISG